MVCVDVRARPISSSSADALSGDMHMNRLLLAACLLLSSGFTGKPSTRYEALWRVVCALKPTIDQPAL
ncbi:hypothetical protein W02_08890 [Nitrospira sp. KM1]|nr:hypothetical protein W02_08890 [Nitrospira sp. KM1]